jgi:hypothetical protein
MTKPTHIAADATLVLMFTVPAWNAEDAARIARRYAAKGFITETTKAVFEGVLMNAVNGYAIAGE